MFTINPFYIAKLNSKDNLLVVVILFLKEKNK